MAVGPWSSAAARWLGAGLLVVCVAVLVVAERTNPAWAWPNAVQLTTSYIALVVSAGVAWVTRDRVASILAVGGALWLAADLLGLVLGALHLEARWELSFELCYLAGQATFALAAFAALGPLVRVATARRISDGMLVGLTGLFALFTLTSGGPGGVAQTWYSIGVLVVDGLFVVFAFLGAARSRPVRTHAALLAASAVALCATDVTFLYGEVIRTPFEAWVLDMGWSVSTLLRAAAVVALGLARRDARPPDPVSTRHPRVVLPLVAAVAAGTAIARPQGRWPVASEVVLGLGLALLLVREALVSAEQRALEDTARRSVERLERQASTDALTGLLRRGWMLDRLEEALAGGTVAVATIDLDRFKDINDTFGHAAGDQVLTTVARRLTVAAPGDLVGRIGGDELLVVRRDATPTDAHDLRRVVRSAFVEPIEVLPEVAVAVGASIGTAVGAPGIDSVDDLLAQADRHAYAEKQAARSSAPRIPSRPLHGPTDTDALRGALAALAEGRISAWYQPIIELATGRTVGVEALARMHGTDGLVRPAADFLPLLAAAGRGWDATVAVLRQAVADFAGGAPAERGWTVSVNLSAQDLLRDDVERTVIDALDRSGLEPPRLVLEIDEHSRPDPAGERAIATFREHGIAIALDDFGSPTSTFGQIASLSPAYLKLDGSLISGPAGGGPVPAMALVEGIVRFAHHLGIAVIAEGVEREAQRAVLGEVGCDLGQGYLWSPAVDLARLIAQEAHRHPDPHPPD